MKKISIIGSGGAGKSTLSLKIGQILQLPVIHLDQHYWKPGWVESEKEDWRNKVQSIVKQDSWVMDGNYGGTFDLRFPESDTIIILDYSPMICMYRSLKRRFQHWNKTRPDMARGCPEKFVEFDFFKWIWNFRRDGRPIIENGLEEYAKNVDIIKFQSPLLLKKWLIELRMVTGKRDL